MSSKSKTNVVDYEMVDPETTSKAIVAMKSIVAAVADVVVDPVVVEPVIAEPVVVEPVVAELLLELIEAGETVPYAYLEIAPTTISIPSDVLLTPTMPEKTEKKLSDYDFQMIDADDIVRTANDRTNFDPEKLLFLAESINANGLAQPITVRPLGLGDKLEIVAGERRYRAMVDILGWKKIPCIVQELSDNSASNLMLAENTSRLDLDYMEEAKAYHKRLSTYMMSVADLARLAGVDARTVNKRLELLNLIPEVQLFVAKNNIALGHAEAMCQLDSNRQILALRLLQQSKKQMPVATFTDMCTALKAEGQQENLLKLTLELTNETAKGAGKVRKWDESIGDIPIRTDLPAVVEGKPKGTTAQSVIEDYIGKLADAGFTSEAATLGTVFVALCKARLMKPRVKFEALKETA